MKMQPASACFLFFLASTLLLTSCSKPPRDFDPRDADNVYTGCRIKKVVVSGKWSYLRDITYNSYNDPITSNVQGPVTNGNPNYLFKYDKNHRLIEFVGLYLNETYEALHLYTWKQNRIVIDSEYTFGIYNGPRPARSVVHYLTYDNYDRIIIDSVRSLFPGPFSTVHRYEYDAQGNLVTEGTTYDAMLNPRRTNKVWMFIDRNYSVNNPFKASAYNRSGLPLQFNFTGNLLQTYGTESWTVEYDCK